VKQAAVSFAGVPTGETFEGLEPYDGKLSRTVLRGEGDREVSDLPGASA